jgi:hypothetical protein
MSTFSCFKKAVGEYEQTGLKVSKSMNYAYNDQDSMDDVRIVSHSNSSMMSDESECMDFKQQLSKDKMKCIQF